MLSKKRQKKEEVKTETVNQYVGFMIGTELYGIDIHAIQEIDRMQSVTKLPRSLPFVEGVINLRGTIIPIVDMSKRFGAEPVTIDRRTRIVIVRIGDQTVGLIVESVTEVIDVREKNIDPAPAMAFAVDSRYVSAVGRIENGLLIILDLEVLFSTEEMSQLQQQALS
jgi:purine-binding chemotaxis protein CheW